MQKVIEIRKAAVYRGSTRVFKDLSLQITREQRVAILGPNGGSCQGGGVPIG